MPYAKTTEILDELAKQAVRKGFARDCMARMKLAIAAFEPYRMKAIKRRKQAGTLDRDDLVHVVRNS